MVLLRTVEEARAFAEEIRSRNQRLALVPTMGFLHQGHLSLMREGRRRADVLAVTLFVNPTQFGPNEDLSSYPRDESGDLKKCEQAEAAAVFAPPAEEIYPAGYQTYVEVRETSQGLCGDRRPGHFRGVATVVAKWLYLFRPQVALFGEKDYQQLQVVRAMNRDLNLGVEIVGVPTVREPDGLAMSSRNAYLKPDERQRALSLFKGLQSALKLSQSGVRDGRALVAAVRSELDSAKVREDYIELVHAQTLKRLSGLDPDQPARLLVAAFVGTTRLIDNVAIGG
jgi:pantoate--beta-alanine ligase